MKHCSPYTFVIFLCHLLVEFFCFVLYTVWFCVYVRCFPTLIWQDDQMWRWTSSLRRFTSSQLPGGNFMMECRICNCNLWSIAIFELLLTTSCCLEGEAEVAWNKQEKTEDSLWINDCVNVCACVCATYHLQTVIKYVAWNKQKKKKKKCVNGW